MDLHCLAKFLGRGRTIVQQQGLRLTSEVAPALPIGQRDAKTAREGLYVATTHRGSVLTARRCLKARPVLDRLAVAVAARLARVWSSGSASGPWLGTPSRDGSGPVV